MLGRTLNDYWEELCVCDRGRSLVETQEEQGRMKANDIKPSGLREGERWREHRMGQEKTNKSEPGSKGSDKKKRVKTSKGW